MSSSTSSIASHLCNVAQAWNRQLVSRDRQMMHEESREAITHDSISCLPFDSPLADPCGHTFDAGSVRLFKKLSHNTLECPISRRAIHVDQFVPNIYAQNVLTYFDEEARRASVSTSVPSSSTTSTTSGTTMEDLAGMLGQVLIKVDDLRDRQKIMHRQITNLVGMSYCDRVVSLVKCNHFASVRDRGLTEDEKRKVNS